MKRWIRFIFCRHKGYFGAEDICKKCGAIRDKAWCPLTGMWTWTPWKLSEPYPKKSLR